ncbi:UDP-N-acetylglucosamine diphosphorylase [Trametopsis cervina]|nr:UDP-N-acetylglucosamine diphosphorylase [Trametopsis cervina]
MNSSSLLASTHSPPRLLLSGHCSDVAVLQRQRSTVSTSRRAADEAVLRRCTAFTERRTYVTKGSLYILIRTTTNLIHPTHLPPPSLFRMAIESLRQRYEAAGQGHLLQFWPQLSEAERVQLQQQLETIDIERVNRIYKKAVGGEHEAVAHQGQDIIEPLPEDAADSIIGENDKEDEQRWRGIGLKAIANGEVGVLLMAGGQGTRLGSSSPKGCYDIGLPSHKTLFQYQAERITRLQTVAAQAYGKSPESVTIPWYVMTSGPTRQETEAFFKKNAYFGLNVKNVIFFEQGTLPCLSMDGKVLLETPSRVAVAPDGNGGLYAALRQPLSPTDKSYNVLADLDKRNIRYIHVYCVDNCLVKVADPVFMGYCVERKADCGAKVVPKSYPTESVGVVARRGSKYGVVEYSEISKEQAERRDANGELAFRAANIVQHFYTIDFLKQVESFEEELAFHIARKKIPYVDESAKTVKPTKPNGMKLEMFVFDVFPFSKHFVVLEVPRNEEFSPLKNAPGTGSDDPETSRRDLLAQQKRFLEHAGAKLADGVEIEISPLLTYAGEGLESVKGKTFTRSGLVSSLEEFDALV